MDSLPRLCEVFFLRNSREEWLIKLDGPWQHYCIYPEGMSRGMRFCLLLLTSFYLTHNEMLKSRVYCYYKPFI